MRNVGLILLSTVTLGLLAVGYFALMGEPVGGTRSRQSAQDKLPEQAQASPEEVLRFTPANMEEVQIPPGGSASIRVYDPHTGRPTDSISFSDWRKVPGEKNEVEVTRPVLQMVLPSGMTASISADSGRLAADRVQRNQAKPKHGRLEGNARIVITRGEKVEPDSDNSDAADEILIEMDWLEFDLELGKMRTAALIRVTSPVFELRGEGLDLEWNQTENRVERLLIPRGEEFVLFTRGGILGDAPGEESPSELQPAATQPAMDPAMASGPPPGTASRPAPVKPPKPPAPTRAPVAYLCTLTHDIVASQFSGDQRVGGLTADEIRLTFDIGGKSDNPLTRMRTTSRPADSQRDRLVVKWDGPLNLSPTEAPRKGTTGRRHFEARGEQVRLDRGGATIDCGRVLFFEESHQAWLYPDQSGRVHVTSGEDFTASANSFFVDQKNAIIKLLGDVTLHSRRSGREDTSIRASEWGQLHLSKGNKATIDVDPNRDLIAIGAVDAASFAGDVRVNLGEGRELSAAQLDVTFEPATPHSPSSGPSRRNDTPKARAAAERAASASPPSPGGLRIRSALAEGNVRVGTATEAVTAEQLEVTFETLPDGSLSPTRVDATGSVVIEEEGTLVRGRRLVATLSPPPPTQELMTVEPPGAVAAKPPTLLIREVEINGDAELESAADQVTARGSAIKARFGPDGRMIESARILGAPGLPGYVRSAAYTVYGDAIDVNVGQTGLIVDGPSRTTFLADRSLQGQAVEGKGVLIEVTANRRLSIDARSEANTVKFEGNVTARSGDEQLITDSLTLYLQDVAESEQVAPVRIRPSEANLMVLRNVQMAIGARPLPLGDSSNRRHSAMRGSAPAVRNKKPVRLVADGGPNNVNLRRGDLALADAKMNSESSIEAPRLEVEIGEQRIRTIGRTTLLVKSRGSLGSGQTETPGAPSTAPAGGEAFGLPSGLISRGPSQTLIGCQNGLTYVIGRTTPDTPRRDSALFEGDVRFRHQAGNKVENLETWLPEVLSDPTLKEKLKGRDSFLSCERLECEFVANRKEPTTQPQEQPRAAAPLGGGMQLATLIASGKVYLVDVQGADSREIRAHQLDFDRAASIVRVRGDRSGGQLVDATIYAQNSEKGQIFTNKGEEFVINLQDNTVRAVNTSGEIRR